ncbi:MAG TPA: aldolase catalytic domain-containing protein [Candidatus Borkfalkia faecipullorum]|uniref:Aldolase catalytic domain-containing protein n=1 Tax=Candidatus Borkfalkia faecipullorum TaxID=2838510 RepID=A0A9D1V7B6_9FIRM|nr:aldolase catalytic domain-containing protein [Candidatus Borkfalkia faecipullorum]
MAETKRKGSLLSFRPDIKVLDATLRDGGLCNDFRFTDEFARALYAANVAAGVDFMELGYKASKKLFDEDKFGKFKFCDEDAMRAVVGENKSDMKLCVMADVGRTEFESFLPRKESVFDMVRVACYLNEIPTAIRAIEHCKKLGYETCANLMAVSKAKDEDIDDALRMLGESGVDCIYLVDSYGSLYPEQVAKLTLRYLEAGEKYKKIIGVHAHNNQQLAFGNTIEAASWGASYLDATMNGMGRGAGNCSLELLLGFLKNPKFDLEPVLQFLSDYMLPLRQSGTVWGYDVPYLLTGRLNMHPSAAIAFVREKRTDLAAFQRELTEHD